MGRGPVRAELEPPLTPPATADVEAAGVAQPSRLRRLLRWTARLALLAFVIVVGVVWLAPQWVLPPLASYLDVSEAPTATDYVLILNGDPETRPFAAAAIVKAGLAREILIGRQEIGLESADVQDGRILTELDITRRVLHARGITDERITVLPGTIGNTWGEAQALATFLDEHPGESVTVVTNGFHTRRARGIFRRVLGARAESVHFVGVPRDGVDAGTWWRTRHGCVVYLTEYAKVAWYLVR